MIADLIRQCIEAKNGNKEFALFVMEDGLCIAEIGNPCTGAVMLGEASGEFSGRGNSPERACANLLAALTGAVANAGR